MRFVKPEMIELEVYIFFLYAGINSILLRIAYESGNY